MQELWMIRPVLYVDLPGIIYAIDHRARSKQQEYAKFVCWLEPVESALPPPPILGLLSGHFFPLHPVARTWICEDHWRLLGFAQIRERPARTAWDISYLASMAKRDGGMLEDDDILAALLEYTLEMAGAHGMLRLFAKIEDEAPELELFQRSGFQRYAREITYVLDPLSKESRSSSVRAELDIPSLRRWHRHHAWGLYQLYRSSTPQRVLTAELYEDCEEFARLHVGSQQSSFSFFGRKSENYICDMGVRFGAWMRISRGRGSTPHRISLIVHPEHADLTEPLIQFAVKRLLETDVRRIYCLVREYDSFVCTALRNSGFEQVHTKVLLVRHIALLATRQSTVPLLEQRAVYGLKGLGTVNSRQKTMR
jgi:N-acetylglutamate synthase-like GNAT family acetyltransferase